MHDNIIKSQLIINVAIFVNNNLKKGISFDFTSF